MLNLHCIVLIISSKKDFKRNKMKWFENKIWHVARNNNNSLKKDQFQELFEVDDVSYVQLNNACRSKQY